MDHILNVMLAVTKHILGIGSINQEHGKEALSKNLVSQIGATTNAAETKEGMDFMRSWFWESKASIWPVRVSNQVMHREPDNFEQRA